MDSDVTTCQCFGPDPSSGRTQRWPGRSFQLATCKRYPCKIMMIRISGRDSPCPPGRRRPDRRPEPPAAARRRPWPRLRRHWPGPQQCPPEGWQQMVQCDSVRNIRVNHQRFIMMSGMRHPWHHWHDHDSERMPVGTGMAIIHCHSPLARRGRRRRPGPPLAVA